jgi:ESS family glutamate:Na+ symporter
MSFSGGHGTVAGLQPQLDMYGASDLVDVGLGLATVSMVIAVSVGSILASRAREGEPAAAQGHAAREQPADVDIGRLSRDRNDPPEPGHAFGLSALSSTLMFVGVAIGLGWLLLHALRWIEAHTVGTRLLESLPLFPLTVIGSAAVQLLARPLGYEHALDRRMATDIGGAALDLLIASAIGTLSLAVIGRNLLPIFILAILGATWSLIVFHQFGPRVFPRNGPVHAAADFGHSVGSVATGFVLLDLADPYDRTEARTAYAYKQLAYEPLFGGGIVTALAVPVIAHAGLIAFGIASGLATMALTVWGIRRRQD